MTTDSNSAAETVRNENARVNAALKDAVGRGIPLGISGESARLIPPPSGYDPFHGRVCLAPGLQKNGFGKERICGRQAVAILRRLAPEIPAALTIEEQAVNVNAAVAMHSYAGTDARVYAGGGPSIGKLIPGPSDPLGDNDHYVCPFHSQAAHTKHLHPEDNGGVVPDVTPAPDKPRIGLSHLNAARQWRIEASDPTVVALTDGINSALVPTREYVAYLRDHGSLPVSGQPL